MKKTNLWLSFTKKCNPKQLTFSSRAHQEGHQRPSQLQGEEGLLGLQTTTTTGRTGPEAKPDGSGSLAALVFRLTWGPLICWVFYCCFIVKVVLPPWLEKLVVGLFYWMLVYALQLSMFFLRWFFWWRWNKSDWHMLPVGGLVWISQGSFQRLGMSSSKTSFFTEGFFWVHCWSWLYSKDIRINQQCQAVHPWNVQAYCLEDKQLRGITIALCDDFLQLRSE